MSQHVSTHALERSIAALGRVGIELDQRRAAAGYDQLQELEHQFQLPISGTARSGAGWTTVDVNFDVAFAFAPEQRHAPLAVPHFSYGPVVCGEPASGVADPDNPDALVAVFCHVVEWARDAASDAVTGARMGIGASVLGGQDVIFQGYIHLTFQGFGSLIESVPPDITTTAGATG